MIDVFVAGVPVAKGRPRTTRTGHVFTPQKTREAERAFASTVEIMTSFRRGAPLDGPVKVTLIFTMPIAKSWTKREKQCAADGLLSPTGVPDLDNLVKLVTDSCNGLLWGDDSQIVEIVARKVYGLSPGTRLLVEAL